MKRLFYLMCLFLCVFTISAEAQPLESATIKYENEYYAFYPDVPVDRELLNYIENNCTQFGVDFYLFLGLVHVETGGTFKTDLISKTGDYGFCQINKRYEKYHCELVGLDSIKFDAMNPYHSVDLAIRLLNRLRQKYVSQYSGEELTLMYLGAYNRGETGMERRSNIETIYARAIIEKSKQYKGEEK